MGRETEQKSWVGQRHTYIISHDRATAECAQRQLGCLRVNQGFDSGAAAAAAACTEAAMCATVAAVCAYGGWGGGAVHREGR